MGTQVLISACQRSYPTRASMHQTSVYDHQLAVLNYLRGTVQHRGQEQYIWKWWRLPAWETVRGQHLRPLLLSFEAPLKSVEFKVVTAFITSLVGGEKPTKVEFLSADNVLKTEEEKNCPLLPWCPKADQRRSVGRWWEVKFQRWWGSIRATTGAVVCHQLFSFLFIFSGFCFLCSVFFCFCWIGQSNNRGSVSSAEM